MSIKETDADDAIRAIEALPDGSVVVVVGASDTGKTTLAHAAVRHAASHAAAPAAFVDGDIGQSELAHAGVVSAAMVGAVEASLPVRQWSQRCAAFIGSASPPVSLVALAAGLSNCAARCLTSSPRVVVVDTPGWMHGNAISWYRQLFDLLRPEMVLICARGAEAGGIERLFAHRSQPPVVAIVRPGADMARKSPAARAARRAARLAAHFRDVHAHTFHWAAVDLLECSLGSGEPVAAHVRRFIGDTLRCECVHAERVADGALLVVTDGTAQPVGRVATLEEHFRTRQIIVTPASSYNSLLCGLLGGDGRLIDTAITSAVDFDARTITLDTPLRNAAGVAQIIFGVMRVRLDGKELGSVRPGSL